MVKIEKLPPPATALLDSLMIILTMTVKNVLQTAKLALVNLILSVWLVMMEPLYYLRINRQTWEVVSKNALPAT